MSLFVDLINVLTNLPSCTDSYACPASTLRTVCLLPNMSHSWTDTTVIRWLFTSPISDFNVMVDWGVTLFKVS